MMVAGEYRIVYSKDSQKRKTWRLWKKSRAHPPARQAFMEENENNFLQYFYISALKEHK